jgi:hypothetical protein
LERQCLFLNAGHRLRNTDDQPYGQADGDDGSDQQEAHPEQLPPDEDGIRKFHFNLSVRALITRS